jgi:hypothetical protein
MKIFDKYFQAIESLNISYKAKIVNGKNQLKSTENSFETPKTRCKNSNNETELKMKKYVKLFISIFACFFYFNTFSLIKNYIIENTKIVYDHLTPEIRLHLITPECQLYHETNTDNLPFSDPFWSIYWPGGQGVSR